MEKNIFENLLITTFYIRYNEKKKLLNGKHFVRLFKKVEKDVCKLEESLLVEDREQSCQHIKEKLLSVLENNNEISDSIFYSLLHKDTDWDTTIDLLVKIIKYDGIISKQEKEVILKLSQQYNIDIESTKRKLKNKYTKKQRFSIFAAALIAMCIVVFGIGAWMVNSIEKKKMDKFNIEEYIKQNPKLIFKTIQFSKLIIHGKPNGTNEHLDKLNILHLKGEADLYIDVNFLRIDSTQTDFLKKELYLIYDSPSQIPKSVDVNIPSGNYTLIEEIEPTPISEEKAKAIAKPISWISGGIGALIGGKFGGTLGSTFGGRLGKFIGSSVGMVSGAASAATAGYVYTKEFFMGLELTNNDLEEKESIIQASKSLIALEIMGGNMLSEPDYDSKLQKYYQAECERQIKEIMKSFGWQEVYVKFNYK